MRPLCLGFSGMTVRRSAAKGSRRWTEAARPFLLSRQPSNTSRTQQRGRLQTAVVEAGGRRCSYCCSFVKKLMGEAPLQDPAVVAE